MYIAVAAAVLAAGSLTACGSQVRSPEGTVTASASANSLSIKVGDCLGDMNGTSVTDVQLIPCAQAHYWEAFAKTNLTGTTYPGETEITKKADEFCATEFKTFVGISSEDSKYSSPYLYPTTESWATGDREIMCFAGLDAGGVKGSLKGIKK
jgi:hypothetical protein